MKKVLFKLREARKQLRETEIKKSGWNKYSEYKYFELGDFLTPALNIFDSLGLVPTVTYPPGQAVLTITDLDSGEQVVFESPFGSASLKAAHEIQNIGACQTYSRRYLWITAMDIVEHDALDSSQGKTDAPKHRPTKSDAVIPPARMSIIVDVQQAILDHIQQDDIVGAYEEYIGIEDPEEKVALWALLDSKVRAKLKAHGQSIKGE